MDDGAVIFPCEHSHVSNTGMFLAVKDNGGVRLYGYDGNPLSDYVYHDVENWGDGKCAVKKKGLACGWGYVDSEGRLVIEMRFRKAGEFKKGLAMVTEANNMKTFIDVNGHDITPPIYKALHAFRSGRAEVFPNAYGRVAQIDRYGLLVDK